MSEITKGDLAKIALFDDVVEERDKLRGIFGDYDYTPTLEECRAIFQRLRRHELLLGLKHIPDYADVMTIDEFDQAVADGSFIDYDGTGYAVVDNMESWIQVRPSDMLHRAQGFFLKKLGFTHVAWYNR